MSTNEFKHKLSLNSPGKPNLRLSHSGCIMKKHDPTEKKIMLGGVEDNMKRNRLQYRGIDSMNIFSVKMSDIGKSGMVFKYQLIIWVFSFLGLMCLFTTLVSPFWSVIIGPHSLTYAGLWNMCRNKKCRSFTLTSKILVIIKALALTSTISGLMTVIFTLLTFSGLKRSKSPLITTFSTGILSLLTMLLYGLSVKPNNTLGSPIPPTPYPIYISWSFVLGCFACFLFLLNGLLLLFIELQKAVAILKEHNNDLNRKQMEPMVA